MAAYPYVIEPCIAKDVIGTPTLLPGSEVPTNEEWNCTIRITNTNTVQALVTLYLGKTATYTDGIARLSDEPFLPKQSMDVEVSAPLRELWRWFHRASVTGVHVSLLGTKRKVDEAL